MLYTFRSSIMPAFRTGSFLILSLLVYMPLSQALKITRVILSANDDSTYLDFWPYAAKAWTQLIGVRPTLALIGDENVQVDESLGDVIRFKPIPGVSTGLHAQLIRLLLPIYFPNDGCIISDIDQLPIRRSYFIDQVKRIPSDKFIVYNNRCYGKYARRFPMCYVAARGYTFKDLFKIKTEQDIPKRIKQWARLGMGFNTDELVLFFTLMRWDQYRTRCVKLNDTLGPRDNRRINRQRWHYIPELVRKHYYIDAHLLRPYKKHKKELNRLATLAGVHLD
jgi:hypothetical protein